MADTVYYNMGQIRYSSDKISTEVDFITKPYNLIDTASNLNYRDILFDFNDNLDSVYCIDLQIPRNRSYNMVFDLLLVKKDLQGNIDLNNYQLVRRIRVPRNENSDLGISTVVLYPIEDENLKVKSGIVRYTVTEEDFTNNLLSIVPEGDIVKRLSDNDTFSYFVNKNNQWVEINKFTDAILSHTWDEDVVLDQTLNFKIVFSNKVPSTTSFNCLLLRMNRQAYEADIQYSVPEGYSDQGETYYGLFVDDNVIRENTKCYELKNWITLDNTGIISNIVNGTLNNIGVWSHPDSIMAINGEEIRIGQSGYYELNDFDITNFSMLIKDSNDKFSMDYQYKKD